MNVEINVNIDEECPECLRKGRTQNGLCLACTVKAMDPKRKMRSIEGRTVQRIVTESCVYCRGVGTVRVAAPKIGDAKGRPVAVTIKLCVCRRGEAVGRSLGRFNPLGRPPPFDPKTDILYSEYAKKKEA